jgi:hypothetical protein
MKRGSRLEAEMEVGAVPVLLSGGKEKSAMPRNETGICEISVCEMHHVVVVCSSS